VTHSRAATVVAKVHTLLWGPLFDLSRPSHLRSYASAALGQVAGCATTYRYATMDKFLHELTALRLAAPLRREWVRCYHRAWYAPREQQQVGVYYVDIHVKPVFCTAPVPVGYAGAEGVGPCLKQVHLHGCLGHPLYPLIRPGDAHLRQEIGPLLRAFEQDLGRRVVHVVVVDREGLSRELFYELWQSHRYVVTLLRANQYRSWADFERRGTLRALVEDASQQVTHYALEGYLPATEKAPPLRCALVWTWPQVSFFVLVTTVPRWLEPEILGVLRWYVDRWPIQENSFKYMSPFVHLEENFGLARKQRVPNRQAVRRQAAWDTEIAAAQKQVARLQKRLDEVAQRIAQLTALAPAERTARTDARWQRAVTQQTHWQDEKQAQQERLARAQAARERISVDAPLYEIDTEKDEIMTLFRVALNNSALWAREHYFGEKYVQSAPESLRRIFLDQEGWLHRTPEAVTVTLAGHREALLQADLQAACARFNARQIRTWQGQLIQIVVAESI
jgi:hypothetical protein